MSEQNQQRGEELFDALSKNKKQRRRRLIRNVVLVIALVAVAGVIAVTMLRRNVERRFADAEAEVQMHTVAPGTLHTTVSGSGVLAEVDLEQISVPTGVEITEVLVEAGDTVKQGQLLASVDMATVMTTLSDLQDQLDDLDDDINAAKGETVNATITAGLTGRVKRIFAQPEMDVSACMAEHGALAVLSLDGLMAVDLETEVLTKGDTVTVIRSDGITTLFGTVESAAGGKATVTLSDNGPRFDEEVTLSLADGTEVGKGNLYIHNPLAVTGYAGTIRSVNVKENAYVNAWSGLFSLKNTSFSANYDTLLRDRAELEEDLLSLLTIYRDGALLSPMDGAISTVQFDSEDTETADTSAASANSAYAAYYGMSADTTASAAPAATEEVEGTAVLKLYPDRSMSITIAIDETDIMALKEGQEAQVEVSSVGDEPFPGTVTKISKVADTSSGVTQYSAEVTLDKQSGMLTGMTASVDVKIQGVENALLIPVDALHRTSTVQYVYTTYDPELQQYGGMVEVTTGMQNDEYVEILSGLEAGDTIYYTEAPQNIFAAFAAMGGGMMGGGRGDYVQMGPMGGGVPGGMGGR